MKFTLIDSQRVLGNNARVTKGALTKIHEQLLEQIEDDRAFIEYGEDENYRPYVVLGYVCAKILSAELLEDRIVVDVKTFGPHAKLLDALLSISDSIRLSPVLLGKVKNDLITSKSVQYIKARFLP